MSVLEVAFGKDTADPLGGVVVDPKSPDSETLESSIEGSNV